jgi:hypothetical protein
MKKVILGALLLLSVCFVSCQSPQDKLISDCEENLKQNLKDPSSYERIDVKIKDTITSLKWGQNNLSDYKSYMDDELKFFNETKGSDLEASGKDAYVSAKNEYEKSLKTLDSIKKSKEPNRILEINVEFKYRAKNSFGALGIEKSGVTFLPDPTRYKKGKDEHCSVYSIKE